MTSGNHAYTSNYIYFATEDTEPLIILGERFNYITIRQGSYASVINRGPGDTYYGIDYWWIYEEGWKKLEPEEVPNKLRAIKLLLDKGG